MANPITNPTKLPFPADKYGITSAYKREAARTIGRIMGDPARLEMFLEVTNVLVEYAHAKFEQQTQTKELNANKRAADLEAARKEATARAKAKVARLKAQVAELNKEIKAAE